MIQEHYENKKDASLFLYLPNHIIFNELNQKTRIFSEIMQVTGYDDIRKNKRSLPDCINCESFELEEESSSLAGLLLPKGIEVYGHFKERMGPTNLYNEINDKTQYKLTRLKKKIIEEISKLLLYLKLISTISLSSTT